MNEQVANPAAFPAIDFIVPQDLHREGVRRLGHSRGMELRDYFIAHAPAEPQPWFAPVMPTERPQPPELPDDSDEAEHSYVREFREVMRPDEVKSPQLRAYVEAFQSFRKQGRAWDAEATKQRYVQWPTAWADEMLKARATTGTPTTQGAKCGSECDYICQQPDGFGGCGKRGTPT